jgi:membrane protein required for colicin V production
MATPLMQEIPILSEFLGDSCELSVIAAFAGVFAIALILISIFTPVFAGAVQRSALGGIDQGLGFLFGVARGVLLVAVALIIYDRVMVGEPVAMVDDSRPPRSSPTSPTAWRPRFRPRRRAGSSSATRS